MQYSRRNKGPAIVLQEHLTKWPINYVILFVVYKIVIALLDRELNDHNLGDFNNKLNYNYNSSLNKLELNIRKLLLFRVNNLFS